MTREKHWLRSDNGVGGVCVTLAARLTAVSGSKFAQVVTWLFPNHHCSREMALQASAGGVPSHYQSVVEVELKPSQPGQATKTKE
ncbi:hypothetical protein Vi05172_g536 [Venturia inaequalis]|nr:hypothetical protein Vi05172_g536 [Venturia inaequalis]